MKNTAFILTLCVLHFVGARTASAQSIEPASANTDESITITVSTEGLGKYTEEFSTTVLRLERLLDQIRKAELSLPTEDMQKLEELVAASTLLIEAVGKNAEQITTVIADAQAPVLDLSAKVLDQAEQRVVTPVMDGVDSAADKVSKSLSTAVIALWILVCLVLVVAAAGAYLLNQRVRSLLTSAGKIIDGHVVVPRSTWEIATAPLGEKKKTTTPD